MPESARNGMAGVVRPTTPTRTPPGAPIQDAENAGWPSVSRTMLAESHGNVATFRACSSSESPKSNSWLPSAMASYPMRLIAAIIGSGPGLWPARPNSIPP